VNFTQKHNNIIHASEELKRHFHTHIDMNNKSETLQSALKLGKWPHFAEEVKRRNQLGAQYSELLGKHDQIKITTPKVAEGNTHVYAQYTVRVDAEKRDDMVDGMKKAGIPVGVYYSKCFHGQPVFKYLGYEYGDFPESEKASKEVLSLPMHPFLEREEMDVIIEQLKTCVE